MSPEDNKNANILCGISLACELLPLLLGVIGNALLQGQGAEHIELFIVLGNVISSLKGISVIAGIVLMIIVRVKYPKNVFGKVLMWVYIVIGVVTLILIIAAMVICAAACNECFSSCQGLG